MTAILYGAAQALFSMHVLHDASHCGISHKPIRMSSLLFYLYLSHLNSEKNPPFINNLITVWRYIGVTFDFLVGGSFFAWLHQHSIGHHLYTNVRGADPDLGTYYFYFIIHF